MDLNDKSQKLREVKVLIHNGCHEEARQQLRSLAHPGDPLAFQMKYASLWRQLPTDPRARVIRAALIATSSVEHLAQIWQFWLAQDGFLCELYVAPFGVFPQEILDSDSPLYHHHPDLVWILEGHRDFRISATIQDSPEQIDQQIQDYLGVRSHYWELLIQRLGCEVMVCNVDLPATRGFGNLEASAMWSPAGLLRRYNTLLAQHTPPGVIVLDLDHVASCYGRRLWHDPRFWYHSRHAFALDATGEVAFAAARLAGALRGLTRKVLVLDLDNTLWGGVIGDDGLSGIQLGDGPDGEAFVTFQKWIKQLRDRGIVLAVSSKNTEVNAREPFQKHPAMVLRLSDLAAFKADWRDKATHLREIAAELELGLDSFVFVDDNPAERALIRRELPQVHVPELPSDPAFYVDALSRWNYFEVATLSREDRLRADAYAANAQRSSLQQSVSDLPSFLMALRMVAQVGGLSNMTLPRIAQLINKSNQFHLTTTRYTEAKLVQMVADGTVCRWIQLRDQYGDHGLISVVLARADGDGLTIDTWVMSCRVLSRGVEHLMMRVLVEAAKARGITRLRGQYRPTPRNGLVAELYPSLGFNQVGADESGSWWELDVNNWAPAQHCYIDCLQEQI